MSKQTYFLIVITGPTAVGKSKLALELAQKYQCDILSADSRQIYNELTLGTAKPSTAELKLVKHHFVNHRSIHDEYSVGFFQKEGLALLDQLFLKNPVQILCGGSGLYIDALSKGLDDFPDINPLTVDILEAKYQKRGIEYLQEQLKEKDLEYYKVVDLKNARRIIRALSVIEQTGKPFSAYRKANYQERNFKCINILLNEDREVLYDRINRRVDQMIAMGLENEVKGLNDFINLKALNTVGYQEWRPYFKGIDTKEQVIELIKRNSRRYAKRQMTWFRRDDRWNSFFITQQKLILDHIEQAIKE